MEKLSFKVQEFEGPLDLLLHLIAKHKLNIYDIEISALLEQYLAYIEQMQPAGYGSGQRIFRDGGKASAY